MRCFAQVCVSTIIIIVKLGNCYNSCNNASTEAGSEWPFAGRDILGLQCPSQCQRW